MARREKPAAEELAKIHLEQLDVAKRAIMGRLAGERPLSSGAITRLTLSLTRVLAAEAKYVDVYMGSQGQSVVGGLLELLVSGAGRIEPMTISEPIDDDEWAGS